MPRQNYKGYEQDEIPPDDFGQDFSSGEKVFKQDPWEDEPEKPATELDRVKEAVAALPAKTIPKPVSEPAQTAPEKVKRERSKKGQAKGQKVYKQNWRTKNRDHYLAKNREYVARSRAKKASLTK